MGKNHKVFALFETMPYDIYDKGRLMSIHKTMEGAQSEVRQFPLHPFEKTRWMDVHGVLEAKPLDGYALGVRIVPMDLRR